jgi:hypothetical protein
MPIWLLAFVMPEKPGHVWVPFLGAGGGILVALPRDGAGKGGGGFLSGAGTAKYL